MTADEIIQELTIFNSKFPRQALSEAPEHREELIPRLLDSLDYVADNIETLMDEDSHYDLHHFAMFLLAQFREQRAFPKLVRFLYLGDKELDFIMGDTLTEHYKTILCSTYNGDINLLKAVIENAGCFEFARIAAVDAYAFIVRDGHFSRKEMTDYFRYVIGGLKDDDTAGASALVSAIIDEHILELIPEVRFLYGQGLVETFINGPYEGFLNHIFNYTYDREEKLHIDDIIGELEHWACYNPEPPPKPKPVNPPPAPEVTAGTVKKKIGRNDPCPCGSGKKYKKCCLLKGITFKEETGKEESAAIPERSAGSGLDLRGLYDESKPYNLLTGYPGMDPEVKEGDCKFAEFFSPEAVEFDIPVYKALYHRTIPIWVKRNRKREDRERITLLLDAFKLFTQTCARDGIDFFAAYDEKYMVHYHAADWIDALRNLLEEWEDEIPQEQYAMFETVSQTLERMAPKTAEQDGTPLA
ncbi:MAG: DUF1186 domain-containing protein [Treponema sp.]|jgi:hypothetical protein|nr:DUF1186 domain-containing protein [Treponema sp.]